MIDAPERIWVWGYPSTDRDNRPCDERGWDEDDYSKKWYAERDIALTEYTRADLALTDAQVMAHPKVRALVEATKEYRSSIAAFDGSGRLDEKSNRLHAANMSLDAALRDLDGV